MDHHFSVVVVDAPIGPVTVWASREGVIRVGFGDRSGDTVSGHSHPDADRIAADAVRQLTEYFARRRERFDLPLDWSRSAGWPKTVRQRLHADIGYGQTVSYGKLAALAGRPDGARAVGGIMAGNPIPIIVACHRVVASDGGIGGFAGSGGAMVETKRKLLELEGSAAPTLFDL